MDAPNPTNGDCKKVEFRNITGIIRQDSSVKMNLLFAAIDSSNLISCAPILNIAHLIRARIIPSNV